MTQATALQIVVALLLVAVGVCVASLVRLHRGLRRLGAAIAHLGRSQAAEPMSLLGPAAIDAMAEALNRMAGRFHAQVRTALAERNQIEAVLTSMVEGVLAVDPEERLTALNPAAAQLLEIEDPPRALGRTLQEVVRNTALQQFVARMLSSESPAQGEIELRLTVAQSAQREAGVTERYVRVQGAALRDALGRWMGALVVLEDVTRLRRLELVRRDFVANVSHEIKTPVTAIKAAAETLLESRDDPAATQHFLEIMHRQAERLHSLVDDILSLARIEQDTEKQRVVLKPGRLLEPLTASLDACQMQAAAKDMKVELACDPALQARLNGPLLEHAVVNLLDNAIKYCPAGTPIRVSAQRVGTEVVVAVQDQGPGIEAEHLPRIFERFYRTDKSRGRNRGGTGLGLAIVKHAAQAQGGYVTVDSTPGKGSTFRIHLPLWYAEEE